MVHKPARRSESTPKAPSAQSKSNARRGAKEVSRGAGSQGVSWDCWNEPTNPPEHAAERPAAEQRILISLRRQARRALGRPQDEIWSRRCLAGWLSC